MNYELWLIFAHPGKNLPKFLVPRSSFIVTKNPWFPTDFYHYFATTLKILPLT